MPYRSFSRHSGGFPARVSYADHVKLVENIIAGRPSQFKETTKERERRRLLKKVKEPSPENFFLTAHAISARIQAASGTAGATAEWGYTSHLNPLLSDELGFRIDRPSEIKQALRLERPDVDSEVPMHLTLTRHSDKIQACFGISRDLARHLIEEAIARGPFDATIILFNKQPVAPPSSRTPKLTALDLSDRDLTAHGHEEQLLKFIETRMSDSMRRALSSTNPPLIEFYRDSVGGTLRTVAIIRSEV